MVVRGILIFVLLGCVLWGCQSKSELKEEWSGDDIVMEEVEERSLYAADTEGERKDSMDRTMKEQAVILEEVAPPIQPEEEVRNSITPLADEPKLVKEKEVRNKPAPEPISEGYPIPKPKAAANDEIFSAVEVSPQFPGGNAGLYNWLANNTHYPAIAAANGIQGKVVVQFVVEKDGRVSNVSVVRSVDKDLDQEAVRVVKKMPKWKPGTNNGSPVRTSYTLPVHFRFQE